MRISRLKSRPIAARSAVLTALLAVVALTVAQPASADIGEKIILRCTHGESLSGFSQSAYRQALKELSADSEEYSGCSLLIREAERAEGEAPVVYVSYEAGKGRFGDAVIVVVG